MFLKLSLALVFISLMAAGIAYAHSHMLSHRMLGHWHSTSGSDYTLKDNGIAIKTGFGRGNTVKWSVVDEHYGYLVLDIGDNLYEIYPEEDGTLRVEYGSERVTWAKLEVKE